MPLKPRKPHSGRKGPIEKATELLPALEDSYTCNAVDKAYKRYKNIENISERLRSASARLDKLIDQFVIDIKKEINIYNNSTSDTLFKIGDVDRKIKIDRIYKNIHATADTSALIQVIGGQYGCHECGTDVPEAWIADHSPPLSLSSADIALDIRNHYPIQAGAFRVAWQCLECSKEQSKLVRVLNFQTNANALAAYKGLPEDKRRLLVQDKLADAVEIGSKSRAAARKKLILEQGSETCSCHSCNKTDAVVPFICDHQPPTLYCKPSFIRIYNDIRNARPELSNFFNADRYYYYLPHCPLCSSRQGARQARLYREAEAIDAFAEKIQEAKDSVTAFMENHLGILDAEVKPMKKRKENPTYPDTPL